MSSQSILDTGHRTAVAQIALAALDSNQVEWCALSGYQSYPAEIYSDLDILVRPADFLRVRSIMRSLGGIRLLQEKWYESKGHAYISSRTSEAIEDAIAIDVMASHTYRGLQIMPAGEFLDARQQAPTGLWITAPEKEFIYYLTKRIAKSARMKPSAAIGNDQETILCGLFKKAPDGCKREMDRFFPANLATIAYAACDGGDWSDVRDNLTGFLRSMRQNVWRRAPVTTPFAYLQNIPRLLSRVFRPNGMMVVLLGADGAGKTRLTETLPLKLDQLFDRCVSFHLRPRSLSKPRKSGEVVDPYEKQVRGSTLSALQAIFWWADFFLGYWVRVYPKLVRQNCVIFDRYHIDLQCDPARYRFGGRKWVARVMSSLLPQPGLYVILDIDPETANRRQAEMSVEDSAKQRESYLRLADERNDCIVVDASQCPTKVANDVTKIISSYMAERTSRRRMLWN